MASIFLSVAKIGRDNDFSCRNQYVLQVCYNSSIVIQSTDANVIETASIKEKSRKEEVDGFKLGSDLITPNSGSCLIFRT